MKAITFEARIGTGDIIEMSGYPTPARGLVVHEAHLRCAADREWMLTHARSGLTFPFCWDSPEGSLVYAIRIADLGDWTASGPDLAAAMRRVSRTLVGAAFDAGAREHTRRGRWDGAYLDNGVIA